MGEKQEYTAIDIARFVCAFLVVSIHTEVFCDNIWLDRALGLFTRIPVPFFFTASGFFLFLAAGRNTTFQRIKKYLIRILLLYGLWSVIYLPFFINNLLSENISGSVLLYILKSVIWTGVSSHLWFLPATVIAVLITRLFYLFLSPKKTIIVASAFLLFGTVFSTYSSVINSLIGNNLFLDSFLDTVGTRNGLFYGFFYVAMGGLIASDKSTRGIKYHSLMFAVSFAVLVTETAVAVLYLHVSNTIMWFATPFVVYHLYILLTKVKPPLKTVFAQQLRHMSSLIYTSQFVWIYLLTIIGFNRYGVMIFIGASVLASAFSLVFLQLSKKITWLRFWY